MRDAVSTVLGMLDRGEQAEPPLRRWAGQVTRSDARGVYATEIGHDEANPTGPLRGATYRDLRSCAGGPNAHTHPLLPLPKGTAVLVEQTEAGPWVYAVDERTLPQ